jgi:hypothetical protein
MSVGMFLGITPSFLPEFADEAERFMRAINRSLSRAGFGAYLEPDVLPDAYVGSRFGRSALDNHGAGTIAGVAKYALGEGQCRNLAALANNPCRVAFLPQSFASPIETDFEERIGGVPTRIWIGSLPGLSEELRILACALEVPLEGGELSDETAQKINDFEPLSEEDSQDPDDRTVWLMLYEGCRVAMRFQLALSFAG